MNRSKKMLFLTFLLVVPLALFVSMIAVAENNPSNVTSPDVLMKGTELVINPASTDEFYIIAENDEPRLKEILVQRTMNEKVVPEKPTALPHKALTPPQISKKIAEKIITRPTIAPKQAMIKKLANKNAKMPTKVAAKKIMPPKTRIATKNQTFATKKANIVKKVIKNKNNMLTKSDIKNTRSIRKPSKMELALSSALEKAINKKQFKVQSNNRQAEKTTIIKSATRTTSL